MTALASQWTTAARQSGDLECEEWNMNRPTILVLLSAICLAGKALSAAEPVELAFDTNSGYFVSNKFEPDAAKSFVVARSQEQFDKVFGVAFVKRDKSHRLTFQVAATVRRELTA
jgi:hypothetical protein